MRSTAQATLFDPEPPPRTARRAARRPISPNWRPSPDQLLDLYERFDPVLVTAQVDRFRDHHLAKGTRYADWLAAYRTWLQNELDWAEPPKPAVTESPSTANGFDHSSILERMRGG